MQKFILLTIGGRVGSGWLGSMLRAHPRIRFEQELLKVGYKPRGTTSQQRLSGMEDAFAWLASEEYSPLDKPHVMAAGFKLGGPGVSVQNWLPWLAIHRPKLLLLSRRHHVEQVLSAYQLRQGKADRVHINDIGAFIQEVQSLKPSLNRRRESLKKLNLQCMELEYEKLLKDADTELDKIFAYLALPPHRISHEGDTKKRGLQPVSQRIINWLEVRAALIRAGVNVDKIS